MWERLRHRHARLFFIVGGTFFIIDQLGRIQTVAALYDAGKVWLSLRTDIHLNWPLTHLTWPPHTLLGVGVFFVFLGLVSFFSPPKVETKPAATKEQDVQIDAAARAPTKPQPQQHDAESASLSPLRAREVLLHEHAAAWHEASTDLARARRAIVLPFKNVPKQPGQRTPRANDVSASLVFKNVDASDEMHINHGVWLGRVQYPATFDSGVTHELLVALKDAPFVTFENPNSYNPFGRAHFRSGMSVRHPQMKTIWTEGTVEIVLVNGHNMTMFQGMFEYQLSVEKMILTPKALSSGSKVHFVPDPYNCGWAGNDGRTDVRAGGIFTYDGDGMLTIVDAFLKGTTPRGKMMVQILVGDGLGPVVPVNSLELHAHTPVRVALNLMSEPTKFVRGKPIRGELVLRDIYNKEHEIDPVDFPWIGQQIR